MCALRVIVCEVGPRDGLQSEPKVLPVELRAEMVNRLSACGLPRIEVSSFVNPSLVPQMADAEDVVSRIGRRPEVTYAGLVLNEKGYKRLQACGLNEVRFALAATETFNRRNQNASIEQSLAEAERVISQAHSDGLRTVLIIGVAFGCPFEGNVDPGRVLSFAERLAASGADEILFADTIGVAVPKQVRRIVQSAMALGRPIGVHLHNTRNTGFANACAALEAGATIFDAAVAGIGGCPFAPRATGNIATEDLVYLLHGEGIDTGVNLEGLISVARWLEDMLGRPLPGQVYRAGPFPGGKVRRGDEPRAR